jgi:nucleotide-binding universal stress UspA family protein
MFKNVLVGVDGKPNGRDAAALARQLTDPDGKLTLVHSYTGELRFSHGLTKDRVQAEREASETLLQAERTTAGVGAELESMASLSPARGLHQEAEARSADLIVVGSSSRGAWGRAMLGDDARAALNGAPCAVAIAARGYSSHATPFAKVGVAYNDSPESEAALAVARTLAAPTEATVRAVEVVSMPTYAYTGVLPPALGDTMEIMIKESNERLGKLPGVDGHAVYGLAGEELAAFSGGVDLLVVGSRGYGPVMRLVLGSTSDYLERHARCSLLVLPRPASTP